jgi:predicted Zn finger-like uncharacterized protein
MDVTCDRCGTDYEFEETLVSTRGTTVKCTSCGHLFKVYKPGGATDGEAGEGGDAGDAGDAQKWTVRRTDGSIHRLASLGDLTRLIGEGAFSRDDEVSRTGKAWKKLGEIDELTGFFPGAPVSDEAPAATAGPSIPVSAPRPRRSTQPPELGLRTSLPPEIPAAPRPASSLQPRAAGVVDGPEPAARSSIPNPAPATPAARFETLGGQVELDARGAVRNIHHDRSSQPRIPVASSDLDAATTSRQRAVSAVAIPPAATAAPAPRSEASYAWLWATLILLASAAAAGFLLWPTFQERMKPAPATDPTAEFIARADAAFATHRLQHFEEAVTDYTKALAFHESDPHILSSLSRVYAVWAQETRFKAQGLRQLSRNDVAQRSELAALDKEQRQLAEQAKRYAENAARKNPGNEEAEIALADALRLNGNLVAARSELDRARATQTTQSGETLRVAALLAIDEAKGDLRAGTKLASQAVAQEPELIRTRLLLARCLVADGDKEGARYQLSAVQTRDRSHPGALLVLQELDRPADPTPAPAPAPPTAGESPSAEPDFDIEHLERLKYDELITRGQRMLETGNVALAKRMFEQALFTRPSSGAAHTGLGYVALEKGRPQLAVEHFLPAARAGNLDALIGLGDAYRRIERPRDALKAYQKYLTRDPNGKHASIARSQVERLTDTAGGAR